MRTCFSLSTKINAVGSTTIHQESNLRRGGTSNEGYKHPIKPTTKRSCFCPDMELMKIQNRWLANLEATPLFCYSDDSHKKLNHPACMPTKIRNDPMVCLHGFNNSPRFPILVYTHICSPWKQLVEKYGFIYIVDISSFEVSLSGLTSQEGSDSDFRGLRVSRPPE